MVSPIVVTNNGKKIIVRPEKYFWSPLRNNLNSGLKLNREPKEPKDL
jgi:hypothetical protein